MALRQPPSWLQEGEHPAANDRLLVDGLLQQVGVVGVNDMLVTASTGMNISVAAGAAFVQGTSTTFQGVYHAVNDGPVTLTIGTAPSSNPRIDAVVLQIKDADVAGAENVAEFVVVAGTPGSTPVVPTIPSDSLLLAAVTVGVGVTSITSGNITDRRGTRATAIGGVLPVTSTTRPTSTMPGMVIYEIDTKTVRVHTGSAWVVVADTVNLPTVFNPPGAYAYQSSAQTIPNNTATSVAMQTTRYDNNSMHSTSTNNSRLTCRTAGIYLVTAGYQIATSDTGLRRAQIYKNGALAAAQGDYLTTSTSTVLQLSIEVPMTVNDYVELKVVQQSGNNLNLSAGMALTYISARWVAPLPA